MIRFAGHDFEPDASGVLFWPAAQAAVVADLHLEQGSYYAGAAGRFLPPYDSRETLERLSAALAVRGVRRLVFLGDSFHDERAYGRLDPASRAALAALAEAYACIWIAGNHDEDMGGHVPGIVAQAEWAHAGITFRHIARTGAYAEISGHYHPCATIRHKGAAIRRKCFVAAGDEKLILPAFGALTGGLCVSDAALRPVLGEAYEVYLLGSGKVYRAPRDRLSA